MSDSPETEEIEGGRPSKRQRLSPPTNTPTTARTIISIDAGTTYGTIAVLRQSAHVPHKDITTADITYLDGYAHERSSFSQRSDATPMAIYYDPEKGGEIVWGWEVGARLEWAEDSIHQHLDHYIGQFKLLLDETKATTQIRGEIQKKVQVLKKARLIKDDDDILYHFLVKWFEFARERDLDHGDLEPEFVVCVPSAYSVHSFHRWFKTFDRAIRAVWTSFSNTAPPKIFTISEPAAAASLLMSQNHITLKVSCLYDVLLVQANNDGIAWRKHACD
jgi:molecular chaperone DnaK (HSP70)